MLSALIDNDIFGSINILINKIIYALSFSLLKAKQKQQHVPLFCFPNESRDCLNSYHVTLNVEKTLSKLVTCIFLKFKFYTLRV